MTKRKEREQDTAHPLTLHVTYTAFPGKRNVFLQAVQEARIPEITRQEAGCFQYNYCVSEENPDQILLTEQWTTEAQQQAHLKQPHMQRQQQIKQTCIAKTTVEKC
ncbi:MAG: antibiotic biosynthesis monooxygenase family protein [Ruminococcus sp.]|nr:antibiotic biosynthesis monooxygenase family protein [Ruminococcus sp.]MEE0023858.1 antibiotic biosynthesis monooxygenase family protein [Ruminococcus sp.]